MACSFSTLTVSDAHHDVSRDGEVGEVLVVVPGQRVQALLVAPDPLVHVPEYARSVPV